MRLYGKLAVRERIANAPPVRVFACGHRPEQQDPDNCQACYRRAYQNAYQTARYELSHPRVWLGRARRLHESIQRVLKGEFYA